MQHVDPKHAHNSATVYQHQMLFFTDYNKQVQTGKT